MTKTSSTLLALALAASTFATGCAVDSAVDSIECADEDCSSEAQRLGPETGVTSQENHREAALAAWTIRLADGDNDACDDRVVRYFEEQATDIVLDGCEASFIPVLGADGVTLGQADTTMHPARQFAAGDYDIEDPNAVKPVLIAVGELTVAEREWVLLGLELSKNEPLTARQDMMLDRADELVFHTREREAGRSEEPPRYSPEYL